MGRVLFVRHGESEGNASGIIQGRLDFGLTPAGFAQAEAVAHHLASEGATRLFSSPLRRAWQTAEAVSATTGLVPEPDDALREYDIGEASGLNAAQVRERFPGVMEAFQEGRRFHFPGAEDRDAFHERVRDCLERLLALDTTVVAIAHGGVVASVCTTAIGAKHGARGLFEAANCAITEVMRDRAGRLVLVRVNDTCHLAGAVTTVDRG